MKSYVVMIGLMLALFAPVFHAEGKESHEMSNRLAGAASPYLRQHASNPVDWYEWGQEAFDRARRENRPIFLSIGYSTCHWCHVMEKESFENPVIAKILNDNFVAIKVDRERRPDIDETYMLATQIITQRGGWPNSLFLTPDRKPFYAGAYFPPETFASLLRQVAQQWRTNADRLKEDGERVSDTIAQILNRRVAAQKITPEALQKAEKAFLRNFDELNGGFGEAPKFPHEPSLMFLLQRARMHNSEAVRRAVTVTLDAMLDGGIHDHVGGGFHRYATDNVWLVPHFEKMLYNQAQMVRVLLGAYRLTGKKRYADAAERTLSYVEKHMTSPEGGFYSAWDADSEGAEGVFYVWTPEQLNKALGAKDGALAAKIFGVSRRGNFEHGASVLHFPQSPAEQAKSLNMTGAQFDATTKRLRDALYRVRSRRVPPHLDDKIVLSWNGMMITALFEAALVLDKPVYAQRAQKALDFIENRMKAAQGNYHRSYFDEEATLAAQQEDYAHLALAYVLAYDNSASPEYLQKAQKLAAVMERRFLDSQNGDFYMTASNDPEAAFTRGKVRADNATASGNATALELYALLARRSEQPDYRQAADRLLAALSGLALETPTAAAFALRGADMMQAGEGGPVSYFAQGRLRVRARLAKDERQAIVRIKIAPGWHINSDQPGNEDFIATRLELIDGKRTAKGAKPKIFYPQAVRRKPGFSKQELSLFEGTVEIRISFAEGETPPNQLLLNMQACSDSLCLEPVSRRINLR